MTCETCGEKKPKNDSPSFTKATVEILNPKELSMFRKVVVPTSMGDDTTNPPKVGKYCNVLLYYEANEQAYLYSSDGIPTKLTGDLSLIKKQIKDLQDEDVKIWDEIELIEMSSDVVDIVGTYAELQQYDTSKLHNNDIIKVLKDETHSNETAYYRWSTATSTFSYVGSEGPYYTESEIDTMLAAKQNTLTAGANITIDANNEISAVDTTYTHFTGATASTDGVQGLVPGPLAGDENKFLKADGTWEEVSGTDYVAGDGIDITNDEISVDDTYVQRKLTAGSNIQISGTTISATDTTYSNFVGTDGQTAGTAGLVPAPATTDAGKYLNADGTWQTVQAGPTVVQTTGTSTTDVMSQDATTKMIYPNTTTYGNDRIALGTVNFKNSSVGTKGIAINAVVGDSTYSTCDGVAISSDPNIPAYIERSISGIAIGKEAHIRSSNKSIAIGNYAQTQSTGQSNIAIGTDTYAGRNNQSDEKTVAIGDHAFAQASYTVALGAYSKPTAQGQVDISLKGQSDSSTLGYNSSPYRLLTGLYDPQSAHDAATKGYVDTAVTPNNISSNDWSALWQ